MATINLFSDGSYFCGMVPTFGWLAVAERDKVLASGSGRCRNDGTNNVAGEIVGALSALGWAVQAGFDRVIVHSDLSTLKQHFKKVGQRPSSHSEEAVRFVESHPEVKVEFCFTRDSNPLLREAHHLSRSLAA